MKKLILNLVILFISYNVNGQSGNNDIISQYVDIERVTIYETDTLLNLPIEGLLVFKREEGIGRYLSHVFVLVNGDYIEIKPVHIRYIINRQKKIKR